MSLQDYINDLKADNISLRQFIGIIKKDEDLINEVNQKTVFLNEYNPDILERLYYVINDLHDIVKCKYCDNKAIWSGRINTGYKTICKNSECRTKQLSDTHTGNTLISENRDASFIEAQKEIKSISDDIILSLIKYDKHIDLLTNPIIITFLENRFSDSSSLLESYQRIKFKVEKKPTCPTCGGPVNWIGKKTKLYTYYCSDKCAANGKERQQKAIDTQIKNWGTASCYSSPIYREKMKEKYGVEYLFQREDIKEKRKQTLVQRYGVEHPNQNPEILNKVWNTCKSHMTFNTSGEEEQIYQWLQELNYNVIHHYKSEDYPFNCDFYLPDYDLYIEYNGSQFHNYRAYFGTKEDIEEINKLQATVEKKLAEGKNPQAAAIIDTWSKRDVAKREYARNNKINFLEIYKCTSKESLKNQLNMYLCCKDNILPFTIGTDTILKDFKYYKKLLCTDLENATSIFHRVNIVQYFLGNVFYKNEMDLYANDPIIRRKLIQNRIKYLEKNEEDLNPHDLITGFKKSGIYYGYSHFNPAWTNWFINHYNIKTIYDPCGGWGHHLLGMLSCDRIIYNDLSTPVVEGINKMKDFFGITPLEVHNEDGSYYIPDNVDAWFMCPPYFNIERYESGGFETIEDYIGFLNRIFNIWFNSSARVFGFIIREDYYALLNDKYKVMLESMHSLKIATSHFIKSKKHKEYFYILHK